MLDFYCWFIGGFLILISGSNSEGAGRGHDFITSYNSWEAYFLEVYFPTIKEKLLTLKGNFHVE